MAGQPGREQSSFASGELGDLLAERRNIKYYRSGLKRATNLVVHPQGPARQRAYTRQLSRRRFLMETVSLAGATLAAPNGGTATNVADGNAGTALVSNVIVGGPHVLLTVAFPAPAAIAAVDVLAYRCSTGAGRLAVQYQDAGGNWVDFNLSRKLIAAIRSRRFCAPPQAPVIASAWRIVARELSLAAAVQMGEVTFWRESTTYGPARLRPFSFSRTSAYDLVLMQGHGDVYSQSGAWLTGFSLPHTGDEAMGRWRQRLNTGLLFSRTRQPWRIFRENDDYEWESSAAPLEKLPNFDFGDTVYTNAVPARWRLDFFNTSPLTLFSLSIEGDETPGMTVGAFAGLAAPLKAALEELPSIEPGLTVTASGDGTSTYGLATVTFTGAGNEGPVNIGAVRVLNKGDAAISWNREVRGVAGGEPIYSAARGWPGCGIFYQQRLLLGGAQLTPNTVALSVTGQFYDFNTELSAASGAFLAPMDTEQDEVIEDMLTTRALLIFTSRAEYWVANAALDKTQLLNPMQASAHGCAAGVPILENEGAAIFANREGSVLCEFRYNETDQTYVTTRLSLLASHLVDGVSDLALQRSSRFNDANVLGLVQSNGGMRLVTLLREQDVTAFSLVVTDGLFRAVSVNAANQMTALVDRPVNGQTVQFVERFEDGLLVDQAVTRTLEPAAAIVTGLADHEGASVWAIGDGNVFGPFTVIGGSITLPRTVSSVTIGRWSPFLAETLPPTREIGPEIVTQSKIGYATVRVSLQDTTSVALAANGSAPQDLPLRDFGSSMDVPELAAGFTGLREQSGFPNSDDRASIVVTQLRPGRITLRSIVGEGDQ